MPLPLKERIKLEQLVRRIQEGSFDANDVDGLLIKIRPYVGTRAVLREIANFVAHADVRDRGVTCESMTAFSDAMRFFVEYTGERIAVDLTKPMPLYVFRLFRSQTILSNEDELRSRFRLSHQSLLRKIEANFKLDKQTRTCSIRSEKAGREFVAALEYVVGFIHSKPAFDITTFHAELQSFLAEECPTFNETAYEAQSARISLAVLCLMGGTRFALPDGDQARCLVSAESDYRLINGQRRLPTGSVTNEPSMFGKLQVRAEVQVIKSGKPMTVAYPVVSTNLDPSEHCDPSMFETLSETNEFGELRIEHINFSDDMMLTDAYRLGRPAT